MAFLRNAGNLAGNILQHRLGRRAAEHQSDLVRQRQLEVAKYNREQIAAQAEAERQNDMLRQILGDPTGRIAQTMMQSGIPKAGDLDLSVIPGVVDSTYAAESKRKRADTLPQEYESVGSGGTMQKEVVNPFEMATRGARRTERTPIEEGLRAGTIERTHLDTPGLTERKVEEANQLESGTRDEKVTTAGEQSFAQAMGQGRGTMQPDIVDARVSQASRIADAEARAANQTGVKLPTEGESNKAGLWNTMIVADQNARKLEADPRFKGLGPGLQQAMQSPTLMSVGTMLGFFNDPTERSYAQHAIDFSSSLLYLRSGAQSTAQEYARFAFNNFALSSDGTVEKADKQNRRKILLQANQVALNRGKYAAGQTLGRAIQSGQMAAPGISLDPEVLRGINDVLSGAAQ
jgi:hypothetical protein